MHQSSFGRRRALVTALLLALGGCGSTETTPTSPLVARITTAATSVAPGASIEVTVGIANTGTSPVSVFAAPCVRLVEARRAVGGAVSQPSGICPAIYSATTLAPGEEISVATDWSATELTTDGTFAPLAAGTYRLSARIPLGDGTDDAVRSEAVTVTVTP